jgi:uncharacterized protein with PQ loop repeat
MDIHDAQLVAGSFSTLIFIASNLPMVWKAFYTKDMGSYSLAHIGLSNAGNALYWLYVLSLPVGPVWLLHGFNTFVTAFMLFWYVRYEKGWRLLPAQLAVTSSTSRPETRSG